MNSKRKLISLEPDIVEDVYNEYGGKYSRNQISDILSSSISYIHYLCSVGDAIVVDVPFIGYMVCNLRRMGLRIGTIKAIKEKKGHLTGPLKVELEKIMEKINIIEGLKKEGKIKKGNALIRDIKGGYKWLKRGFGHDGLEDFQEKFFN